jgi:hypothetical protein
MVRRKGERVKRADCPHLSTFTSFLPRSWPFLPSQLECSTGKSNLPLLPFSQKVLVKKMGERAF